MTLRETIGDFVESRACQRFVAGLILLNAVTLGLATDANVMASYGSILNAVDHVILAIFVAELAAKLFHRGLVFFSSGWNLFDLVVIGIALVPNSGPFAILRTLRVLRLLRLLSVVPSMRNVVEALITAIPGISSVAALILLIFYVSAILTTNLYGAEFPELFGNIAASMYSLFQVMTLENWSDGIVRPVMDTHPLAWMFFIPFILITSFAVLNLFIGIIVDAMQSRHEAALKEEAQEADQDRNEMLAELRALRAEVAALRERLDRK